MPGTVFQHPADSFLSTIAAQHTAGGNIVLQAGDGVKIGALGANEVYRVSLITNPGPSEVIVAVLECTTLTTDTLGGTVTAVDGTTDGTIASGTPIQVRATAKTFSAIHTAVNNLEAPGEVSITGTTTLANLASVFNKSYVCSGTSANYALTLPDLTTGTYDGLDLTIRMAPGLTKIVTLTCQGSQTLDGQATRMMFASQDATNKGQECCTIVARGGNWFKLSGKSISMTCALQLTANQTVLSAATNVIAYNQTNLDNSGAMGTLGSNAITIVRPGAYVMESLTLFGSLTQTGRLIALPSKNSTTSGFDQFENWGGATGAFPSVQGSSIFNAAAGEVYRVLCLNVSSGSQVLTGNVTGAGTPQACNARMRELLPW